MWRKTVFVMIALVAVAAGCSGGGGGGDDDDDDDDDGTQVAQVSGEITDQNGDPLAGATVTEVGTSNSDTTGADGLYSLTVPADEPVFLRRTATDYYPYQAGVVASGTATLDMSGPTAAEVSAIEGLLGATVTDGIVAADFSGVGTTGGFMVTISAANDGSFVFGPGGVPQAGDTTVAGEDSVVVYYNVAPGTTTVTVTEPGTWTCTPDQAITDQRVDAEVITQLRFTCNE